MKKNNFGVNQCFISGFEVRFLFEVLKKVTSAYLEERKKDFRCTFWEDMKKGLFNEEKRERISTFRAKE